jgi:hypothetical protein
MNRRTPSLSRTTWRGSGRYLAALGAARLGIALVIVPWAAVAFLVTNGVGEWLPVAVAAVPLSALGVFLVRWGYRNDKRPG